MPTLNQPAETLGLREQCDALAQQSLVLEPNSEEFSGWLGSLNSNLGEFIDQIKTLRTFTEHQDKALSQWKDLMKGEKDPEVLFKAVISGLASQGLLTAGAGHLGFIPGGGLPLAAAADLIGAVVNPFSGDAFASPVAAQIHQECLETLFKLVGYQPSAAYGDITSGGTAATLMAFQAARKAHNLQGRDYHRAVVYLGEHTHHCAAKSLELLFGDEIQIRVIPSTANQKMDDQQLRLQINQDLAAGLKPFLLIGTAGSTNLGTVDPLAVLAKIAQEHHLWFHVDGAYGGFFKLCPETQSLFEGMNLADSIVLDPHKGLFLPYGVGAVLIKNKKSQRQGPPPAYLQDRHQEDDHPERVGLPPSPMDVSLELTRPFRSLRLWMALKAYGLETLTSALREKLALTRYLREELQKFTSLEVIAAGDLTVTAFRVVGDPDHSKTKKLLKAINSEGRVFLTSTHFESRPDTSGLKQDSTPTDLFVIRIAILSFRTHRDTIDTTINLIKKHGESSL